MTKRKLPVTENFQLVHITIKATGKGHASDRWIFNNQNKRELTDELKKFLELFDPIKLIGFCVMSNHAHIILYSPKEYHISRSEVAEKYANCYGKEIHPNSHACQKLQKQLNSLSCFMQRFCWHFSYNFNRKKSFKRTGHLWQGRFHDTQLGDDTALLKCWVYVMFNPVKANMTNSPFDYKFNSINSNSNQVSETSFANFYALYKKLSGNEKLSFDDFKKMIIAILQNELERWLSKTEEEQQIYRVRNHFWDRLAYVDKSYFNSA